jgi:hypothetical protein
MTKTVEVSDTITVSLHEIIDTDFEGFLDLIEQLVTAGDENPNPLFDISYEVVGVGEETDTIQLAVFAQQLPATEDILPDLVDATEEAYGKLADGKDADKVYAKLKSFYAEHGLDENVAESSVDWLEGGTLTEDLKDALERRGISLG